MIRTCPLTRSGETLLSYMRAMERVHATDDVSDAAEELTDAPMT